MADLENALRLRKLLYTQTAKVAQFLDPKVQLVQGPPTQEQVNAVLCDSLGLVCYALGYLLQEFIALTEPSLIGAAPPPPPPKGPQRKQ